jgi:hypothetical protein
MTEEEAKTKWCPFTRNGGEAGCNRVASTECIGSACMAWRWIGDRSFIDAIKKHRADTGSSLVEAKEYVESHPELWATRNGYCGLAGKP